VRIRIWGSRGSIAAPTRDSARYGGDTSCIEVRLDDGTLIVLDAGTGARGLGRALASRPTEPINLLLTHLHVDHIEGLGAFAPIWRADTDLHIWGPSSPLASLDERIAVYFSPPLFPLHLSEVPARCTYHDATPGIWRVGGATIHADQIQHPGPTVGYRIEADDRVLTYLTDHEPALGADLAALPPGWISGAGLASGADVLIHDCQYTSDEYRTRVGFGHSSPEHVTVFAEKTGVDRLLLFHHDPMHTDADLDVQRETVLSLWGVDRDRCLIAADGAEFRI
jgi:ribonuclease BN (tRNA processing enzyme)